MIPNKKKLKRYLKNNFEFKKIYRLYIESIFFKFEVENGKLKIL